MTRRIAAQFLTLLGVMLLTPGAVPAKQPEPDLPAMTLEACIETALENNPGLTAAREEESVQSEEIVLARSAFLPQVDALAGYTRFSEPMRVIQAHENNEPGVFDRDLLEAGLILQLPLYQGGRRRADLVIADLGRRRAMEIWKRTRQDLILNLHAVFYKILQLDETERSARASMDALESQKETTQLQLDVGRVAPV
ncbi:TolC family protein, partial [Desulfococcus sp.]|uniref:TolC family protein n=1 Tax=Desulfococcus sp. TaxID=2025834 RepID=UPI003D0A0FD9